MSSKDTPNAGGPGATYAVASLADRPELSDLHQSVGGSAWPEFMLHDPVALANWEKIVANFADDQLSMVIDGRVAAVMNMVPLRIECALEDLPDRGVDWGVEKAVADHEAGVEPNALMGLQIVVGDGFRGQGLSETATREVLGHAARRGMGLVLLPVRPNGKHAFPLIPMDDYIGWTDKDGLPFDNWLRVHRKLGGATLKICGRSMIIPGTVDEWKRWTGQDFPGSGQYIVPFALNPIDIDLDRDLGCYVEPNVWIAHNVRD